MNNTTLKEALNFTDVFFISLGYIVGAGIYSLIYLTTRYSGKYTWISFIIGGLISLMTALSYRDLSEHFDTNASDYDYITQGISTKLKYPLSYLLVILGIVTATTLVLAFTNIFKEVVNLNIPYYLVLILIVIIPTLINIYDVKVTSNVNIGISITETLTLIVLIFFSAYKYINTKKILDFKFNPVTKTKHKVTEIFNKIPAIFHGAFLTVFAYSGFETIPKLAEETKDSKNNIPKAIITSLIVTIVLYVFVSISINSILGVKTVSNTKNPISLAFEQLIGSNSKPYIDVITLLSIFNTILLTILFTSRQIQALSKKNILPNIFTKINSYTRTPINSLLLILITTIILGFIINIEMSSHFVNLLLVIIFVLINISNIMLHKKKIIQKERHPYYSYLGLISTIYMVYSMVKGIIY
jgi:APA family basic amino acid/polyamine antiporter